MTRSVKFALRVGLALTLLACSDATPEEQSRESLAQTDDCAERRERAQALITEPPAACTSDDDCACYPAFVNCGGVTDRERAAAILALKTDGQDCGYQDLGGSNFNCAPRRCTPSCVDGACQRGD